MSALSGGFIEVISLPSVVLMLWWTDVRPRADASQRLLVETAATNGQTWKDFSWGVYPVIETLRF